MAEQIDDIRDRIVFSEKVAHVTFYLVEDKELKNHFLVYSESEKRGLEQIDDDNANPFRDPLPHVEAMKIFGDAIQKFEETLEKKRSGLPTSKQVYFLFCQKIPIPLTLTWGEASDLIEERINQIKYEKEAKKRAKEEKRVVIIKQWSDSLPFHPGDKVQHPSFGSGTIIHAGTGLANVRFQDGEKMLNVTELEKDQSE